MYIVLCSHTESVDPVFPFGIQIDRINVKMIWRWKPDRYIVLGDAFSSSSSLSSLEVSSVFILVANMLCSHTEAK